MKKEKDCSVCPLLHGAGIIAMTSRGSGAPPLDVGCIRESCAWWNEECQQCAVLTLAQAQARPQEVRISASTTKGGSNEND